MSDGALNLQELLRQLGVKSVHELPMAFSIQPTLSVGDASAITPPLLPPTAYFGGFSVGDSATTYGVLRIRSSPSGSFVREIAWSIGGASAQLAWNVVAQADEMTLASSTALPLYDVGPQPCSARPVSGDVLVAGALPLATNPQLTPSTFGSERFVDLIYIPPGFAFQAVIFSTSAQLRYFAAVQDATANLTPTG